MKKTPNMFRVGALEDTILVSELFPRRLTREEALNLAAHLLLVADKPVAFEHASIFGVVLSSEFLALLEELQAERSR